MQVDNVVFVQVLAKPVKILDHFVHLVMTVQEHSQLHFYITASVTLPVL